jgi:hypothetical protein
MGWLGGSGLAALTAAGDGTARGAFVRTVTFMPARAHIAPWAGPRLPGQDGDTRPARYGWEIFGEWITLFLAQLAAPNVTRSRVTPEDEPWPCHLLTDHETGAYAWLTTSDGRDWTVIQNGPARIWDDIEDAIAAWENAGQPALDQFTIHVTPAAQAVRLDHAGVHASWRLPTT